MRARRLRPGRPRRARGARLPRRGARPRARRGNRGQAPQRARQAPDPARARRALPRAHRRRRQRNRHPGRRGVRGKHCPSATAGRLCIGEGACLASTTSRPRPTWGEPGPSDGRAITRSGISTMPHQCAPLPSRGRVGGARQTCRHPDYAALAAQTVDSSGCYAGDIGIFTTLSGTRARRRTVGTDQTASRLASSLPLPFP